MSVLRQGDTAVLTSADPVRTSVVSGLGGVGKTQLALHYADTLWTGGELDLLVWVTAGSRAGILSSYARLAADLTGIEDADLEYGAQRLLEWLANTSARWLVVLDDLQTPSDLRGLWPPATSSGQVLVTTRRRDAAFRGHQRRRVEVGVFTADEALAYLQDLLGTRPHLLDGAAELTERLGYLPLALAQAGAYMLDRDLPCAGYATRLADRRRRLDTLLPDADELPDEHRVTVAVTWSMSVEQANAAKPLGVARPLLEIASCLDPNGCPVEVFASPAVLAAVAGEVGRDITPEDTQDGLACLQRFSLLSVGIGGPSRVVRVHGLVQRATRDQISTDRTPELIRVVADGLAQSWPEIERDTALAQILRANAEALRETGGEHLWSQDVHPVLFHAGASLGENGLASQAVDYFLKLHALIAQHLDSEHADVAAVRHNIAHWRGHAGDPAGAAAALERHLYDRLNVLDPQHPDILTIRHGWAYWQGEAGDPHGAASAMEKLLDDQLRALGPNHPSTLATRHSIARWRGEAGAAAGAVSAFEKLLVDQLKILDPQHPSILTVRHNIAHWRGVAGEPESAAALLQKLLADQERILGPDHPHTLTTRHNIAHWQGVAGNTTRALVALNELLVDRLRILGPDHPGTLVNRHEIAYWYGESGSPERAVHALEELLADEMNILGPFHAFTLAARHEIAHWCGVAGKTAEATRKFHELLVDQLRTLRSDHPNISITRNNFSYWSVDPDGSFTADAALYDTFLNRSRILGIDHPGTLTIRHQIAHWRGSCGDPAGAAEALRELLGDYIRVLGPDHPHTLVIRHNIAHWRGVAGEPIEAARALRDLLADRMRLLGPDHPSTVITRRSLAHWVERSRNAEPPPQ